MVAVLKEFPRLYKRAASGKVVTWQIRVEDHGSEAAIVILYGEVGGAVQESVDVISTGKNIGKKNETTYLQQAIEEAHSRWTKQRDRKRYDEDISGIDQKKSGAPMLAQSYDKHSGKIDWQLPVVVQPKLDGFRCLATRAENGRVSLRSREGKPIPTMDHITYQLERLTWPEGVCTLDGELYVHNVPFQAIASLIKRQQEASEKVEYWVYDLVSTLPVADRVAAIDQLDLPSKSQSTADNRVVVIDSYEVESFGDIEKLHAEFVSDNFEGAIVRHGLAGYEAGKRSYSLLKYKHFDDDEFLVLAVEAGKGPFRDKAILTCRVGSNQTFAVTAPGTLESKSDVLKNASKYVGRLVTVKYQGFSDEGIPRFPVAKSFR